MASRWLIHCPQSPEIPIPPDTFVFFFVKGTSGRSWSIRDYSGNDMQVLYGRDFHDDWTAERVLATAEWAVETSPHRVGDVAHWRSSIARLNLEHLGYEWPDRGATPPASTPGGPTPAFPTLDLDVLLSLPKASKREDIDRMFSSPRSEDYVTWNVARALKRIDPSVWWPHLLRLAERDAGTPSGFDPGAPPSIVLWRLIDAPTGYERASRKRMASSGNPKWVARSRSPEPVEGRSEIDLVFDASDYLVFAEAKLGSDLSARTTYDPDRNQLLRMIDTVIEAAGSRTPAAWMITKDRDPSRLHSHLVDQYRSDPNLVISRLPHRDPGVVRDVVRRLSVITWTEILDAVAFPSGSDVTEALAEVRTRI